MNIFKGPCKKELVLNHKSNSTILVMLLHVECFWRNIYKYLGTETITESYSSSNYIFVTPITCLFIN